MPAGLSDRQRAVLRAACDTFIPGGGDPLYTRVKQMIGAIEDTRAVAKLELLLGLLGNPALNLLFGAGAKPFQAMDADARVRLLRDMGSSTIQLRRAGFQALKRLVHVAHYAWPTEGASHPMWREAGYPGPLPHRSGEHNDPLPLLTVDRDATLECDVVVVGSGAGGGVVAGVLAQAGRSVVVLEKGEYRLPRDFSHVEGDGLMENYLDKALLVTESGSLPILAGSGLGGGTVINFTTSFRLPEQTGEEWNRLSGLDLFTSARLRESFARVEDRLGVSETWSVPSRRDAILEAGCAALGWQHGVIARNVRGCPSPEECGYCGYGCRHNAKQSTTVTYLADAAAAGARIVVRCDVERVVIARGRANGVVARVRRPDGTSVALTVKAKTVVAACGAIHTPALLARSAVANAGIGRGLRLHPATAVGGMFDERIESWIGFQQTRYSDQFADQEDGYGVKFETAALGFALPASAFGWESPAQHREVMKRLAHVGFIGLLVRDRDSGRVVTGRDGRPRVHYELSARDVRHARTAMRGAAELLAQQGAREVFTLQQPPARVAPGPSGWLDRFVSEADRKGYDRCRQAFFTFHQMASCAMGRDPAKSVVGETGESHDVKGLFVADASAFPTSSGVNPMITIMAIADHVARGISQLQA